MSLIFFDIGREFFESMFIGDTGLGIFFIMLIPIIMLLFITSSKEILFIVPIPMVVALSVQAGVSWLNPVVLILIGLYFSEVFLVMINRDK